MSEFEIIPQGGLLSDSGSGNYYVPYNTYYHDNRLQFIILATEMQSAGMQSGDIITGMKFRCGTSVSGRDLANFRIRLQNTTQATSTSWVTNGWMVVCGPITINKNGITANNWYQHNFGTQFTWNGQNLLVDVSRDASDYTSGGGNFVYNNCSQRSCGCYHDSSSSWPYDNYTPTSLNYILQTKILTVATVGLQVTLKGNCSLSPSTVYLTKLLQTIIQANSNLTAEPYVLLCALLQGDSSLAAQITSKYILNTLLQGDSSLAAQITSKYILNTLLQGDSSLAAQAIRERLLSVLLQGNSSLTSNINIVAALQALLQGDSNLTAQVVRERLLSVLLKGDSNLTVDLDTAVAILVINYLLSIADQMKYNLSVTDQATFELKIADILDIILKSGE